MSVTIMYEYAIVDAEIRLEEAHVRDDATAAMKHFDELGVKGWMLAAVDRGLAYFVRTKLERKAESEKVDVQTNEVTAVAALIDDVLAGAGYDSEYVNVVDAGVNYSSTITARRPNGTEIEITVKSVDARSR